MLPVAYYISGHGYGHAVRSAQVVRRLKELRPDLDIHVRTAAPRWFFLDLPFSVSYSKSVLDIGVLQTDGLQMKLKETLSACQRIHQRLARLVEENLAFVGRHKIRLIVGDIPPPCFEIARRASLPSVAIGNFTWDWLYQAYLPALPAFLPVIGKMQELYRSATMALCLPFSCDMEIFPVKKPIPLIARISKLDKLEARERFGLPATGLVALVTFGGYGLERLPWEKVNCMDDFFFVTTGPSPRRENHLLVLPDQLAHYEDLIRAADAVVSKPGYGIVADAISHQVPLLYTPRNDFPEYRYLLETLDSWATSELIPQEELLTGNLQPYLERLLNKKQRWPAVALNGAEVAASEILELLDRG